MKGFLAVLSVGAAAAGLIAVWPATARKSVARRPTLVVADLSSDAHGGRLLWTKCNPGCYLYSRANGRTDRVPVAANPLQDDAQEATLGTGPGGHDVAAYDRCDLTLRNCALYVYDFVTHVERRLPVSRHRGAFLLPTVSGDRIAYAHDSVGHDDTGPTFGIYWSYLNSTTMHRVATEPTDLGHALPQLALSDSLLAYVNYSARSVCIDQSHIHIVNLDTGRDRLIAAGDHWSEVFSPRWDGSALYYGRDTFWVPDARHAFDRGEIARSRVERYALATFE
jgi:hypothetical protein